MKKFSVKYANQLGQDKKYEELYTYVKSYIKETYEQTPADPLAFFGLCYDFGYGVKKSAEQAVVLYQQAAEQGSLIGMFHYAYALMKGYVIEEDKEKAKYLFEKLSKKGMPEAKFYLADLSDGDTKLRLLKQSARKNYVPAIIKLAEIYGEEDISESFDWLKKAVGLNSCHAKYELAKYYYEIKEFSEYVNLLLEIVIESCDCDPEETTCVYDEKFCYLNALRHYSYSLDDYLSKAFTDLGDYCFYPWKCEDDVVDYNRAKIYYEAALVRCPFDYRKFYLLLYLSRAYIQGDGFDNCAKTVVDLYNQCLDIANKNAEWNLDCIEPLFYIGLAYLKGAGVEKNSKHAVEYFHKAMDELKGDHATLSRCKYYLGLCYYFGDGIQKDVSKAIKYWSMKPVFAHDDNLSQIALAYLYEQGIYCQKNLTKANELYREYLSAPYVTADGVYNYNPNKETMLEMFQVRDMLMKIDKIKNMKNENDELKQELEKLKQKCYDIATSRGRAVMMSALNVNKARDLKY